MEFIRIWFLKYEKDISNINRIEKILAKFVKETPMISSDETFFFTKILQSFSNHTKVCF